MRAPGRVWRKSGAESTLRQCKYICHRENFQFWRRGNGTRCMLWTPCNNGDAIDIGEQQKQHLT
jgi:hypothetical protein